MDHFALCVNDDFLMYFKAEHVFNLPSGSFLF